MDRRTNFAAPTRKPFTTAFNYTFPALTGKLPKGVLAKGQIGLDLDVLRDTLELSIRSEGLSTD